MALLHGNTVVRGVARDRDEGVRNMRFLKVSECFKKQGRNEHHSFVSYTCTLCIVIA